MGIITKVLLNTVSIALGNFAWWSDLAIAINTSVVLVAYPYFGAIFVKQALGKKYMSFGLEMVDHHANQ